MPAYLEQELQAERTDSLDSPTSREVQEGYRERKKETEREREGEREGGREREGKERERRRERGEREGANVEIKNL